MALLTTAERQIVKDLVSYLLENRSSALHDLTNKHRQELYVVFAKLSGALEAAASEAEAERQADSNVEPFPGPGRASRG